MSTVSAVVIKRLKNKLIDVKYGEALMWSDEDLVETIFQNKLPWIKLLQWLLSELGGGIDTALADLTGDKLLVGIMETVTGLGLCSSDAGNRIVSGVVITKERQEICLRLIEAIELKRKYGDKTTATDEMMSKKFENIITSRCLKFIAENSVEKETPAVTPKTLQECEEKAVLLQEQIAMSTQKVDEFRESFGVSDENITASDYLEQLWKERESLSGKLTSLVESVKCLSNQVQEVFRSEISTLLPVNVAAPIEMPTVEGLSEKVDNLVKLQGDRRIVEKCKGELCSKMDSGSLEADWSIERTASLPVFGLHDMASSIVKMHENA